MSPPLNTHAVVFDCMIFLQALANDTSPAARALDLVDAGDIRLYVSEQILREVRKVLDRSEVRTALPRITDLGVAKADRRFDNHLERLKKEGRKP